MKRTIKKRHIILAVLAILILCLLVFAVANRDLIQSAALGLTTDSETILAEQEEKDKQFEKEMGIEGMVTEEMIAEAQEEIEELVNGAAEGAVEQAESAKEIKAAKEAQESAASAEDIVAKYTAKLYGVRGTFVGRLNGLMGSAQAQFNALPPEQRTAAAKQSIISSMIGQGQAMEAQCDAMVESILGQMQAELVAAGQSTAPVGQLRSQYQSAKASQRAAFLAMARGA